MFALAACSGPSERRAPSESEIQRAEQAAATDEQQRQTELVEATLALTKLTFSLPEPDYEAVDAYNSQVRVAYARFERANVARHGANWQDRYNEPVMPHDQMCEKLYKWSRVSELECLHTPPPPPKRMSVDDHLLPLPPREVVEVATVTQDDGPCGIGPVSDDAAAQCIAETEYEYAEPDV